MDDLQGQVQDCGVVVQDEVGVGGQHDPVQLEGEPVRVLAGGKLVLLECGGRESADQRREPGLEGGDSLLEPARATCSVHPRDRGCCGIESRTTVPRKSNVLRLTPEGDRISRAWILGEADEALTKET